MLIIYQLLDKLVSSWFCLRPTDLLGPLNDLEALERLVLPAKEPLHVVPDPGDGDFTHWQPRYLGEDVRYPPGTR